MAGTKRQRDIAKALTALLPLAPYIDAEKIRADAYAPHMKTLPPSIAVWLATIAHIRHVHSEYEKLLGEGYDRDSARFFVIGEINDVLARWRATRLLDADDDEIRGASEGRSPPCGGDVRQDRGGQRRAPTSQRFAKRTGKSIRRHS